MKLDSIFRKQKSPSLAGIDMSQYGVGGLNSGEDSESSDVTPNTSSFKGDSGSIKEQIAQKESGGNYKAYNGITSGGAWGKYQFAWRYWGDDIKKVTGVKSPQEFLNNPQAQEDYMDYNLQHHNYPFIQEVKKYDKNNLSDSDIIKLIHFRGLPDAKKYVQGDLNQKRESYNMSGAEYLNLNRPKHALGAVLPLVQTGISLVSSVIDAERRRKEMQKTNSLKLTEQQQMVQNNSEATLNEYPVYGDFRGGFYAQGGSLPQYEVESGEVVQGDAQLQSSKKIASDLHHVTGATHEEGGVIGQGGDRVFSNRLNIPVELLAVLRKSKIKADPLSTYADVAANIGKIKGKFESKLGSYKPRTVNTGKLMLERVDGLLDMVFNTQEQSKLPVFANGGVIEKPKSNDNPDLLHDLGHTVSKKEARQIKRHTPLLSRQKEIKELYVIAGKPSIETNPSLLVKGRPNYNIADNILNLSKKGMYNRNSFYAELAHAYQYNNRKNNLYGVFTEDSYKSPEEYDREAYSKKGSNEYQAHKQIQKDFEKITNDKTIIPQYFGVGYGIEGSANKKYSLEDYLQSSKKRVLSELYHPRIKPIKDERDFEFENHFKEWKKKQEKEDMEFKEKLRLEIMERKKAEQKFAKGGKLPKYPDGAELQTSFDTPQMLKSRQANATLLENKKWMSDWYENRKMPNFGTQVVLNNSKDKLRHNLEEAVNIDVKDDPNYYGSYKPLGRQITVGSPNKSGVLHELTHAVDIGNGVPDMVTNPANYWNKIVYDKLLPTDKPLSSNDLYLRDPYEIHARIMQLRQKAGIKPDEYVTPERLDGFLKSWKKAPNDETFGRSLDELINTFRDNNKLIHALNFSTSNKGANTEYRLGGKLRKYEDGGDPGVPNVVDKSKVWLKDWYANREIPNPAGMAALQQSQNGLQRNLNTVTENNNGVFKSDKHLGYYDPMTHKVAFNENATLSPIDNAATKTHELTHASEYKRNTGTSSAVNWNKKVIESNLPPFAKGDSEYYRNPIEVHARIMELRRTAGFKPNQIVTEQELNDYMDRLDKLPYGKAPVLEIDVQKGLDGVFRDRKRLLNVINLTTDNKELGGGDDYKLGGRIKMLPLPKYARGGALPPRNLSKLRRYSTSPFFNDKPVNEVITLSPYKNRFPNSDSPLTGLEPVVNNSNPNKLPQAEVTAARLPKKPLSINNVTGFQTQNLGDKIKPISAPQQEGVPETGDLEYKPDNANLLLTALGAVGNTLINSKYDTSVKRNLMQNPGYTYNDRSGLSQWQAQQAYRTGLKSLDLSTSQGTQNNAANMMWKTQNVLSQIHNQENQRRDQYNSQYADSVWRTQAANTGIVNQANDMRRDLKNDKLAGYQNILNNTIGNVNTILSERDTRRLELQKLNWIGKRGNLGGRNISDFQQEMIDKILGLTPKTKE